MMMIAFVCGLAIGAMVAYFAASTPIMVNIVDRMCKKCGHIGTIDEDRAAEKSEAIAVEAPTLACPKCGVTGGRGGLFKTAQAVSGHMRACPKK